MDFQFYQCRGVELSSEYEMVLYSEVFSVDVGLDKRRAEQELQLIHSKDFAPHFPADDGQLILTNTIGIVAVERRNETNNRELVFTW